MNLIVQVIKKDHVAAGLCCIQLFMNSSSQEEAIKHLENAKVSPYTLKKRSFVYIPSWNAQKIWWTVV